MVFILKNNVDKKELFIDVEDKADSSLFYHFDVILPTGLADGEYTYTLKKDDGTVLNTGLCQIGDHVPEKTTYTTNNNGYKQYQG